MISITTQNRYEIGFYRMETNKVQSTTEMGLLIHKHWNATKRKSTVAIDARNLPINSIEFSSLPITPITRLELPPKTEGPKNLPI